MGIHFVCKTKEQPIFRNDLVPGRSIPGINGGKGDAGTNGPSIHFSDYSPSNDYIKGILREKIKNNLVLSSGNTIKLQNIKYVDGDLILSKDLLVYRLIIDGEDIGFTYLGKLTDKQKEAELIPDETLLNAIGEIEFMKFDSSVFDITIPSNRCVDSHASMKLRGIDYTSPSGLTYYPDSSTRVAYSNTFKKTFGFNFIPIIHITDGDVWNDWDFYLRIYMKINKSPQYNSYILGDSGYEDLYDPVHKNMQGAFEFYKYAEIKLNAKKDSSYQINKDSSAAIYNITDMSCDKLHPAGNNVNSNFVSSYYYKTKNILRTDFRVRIGGIDYLNLYYNDEFNYGPGSVRQGEIYGLNQNDAVYAFHTWSMQQFQELAYKNQRGYLQYSLYKDGKPNFRSGDSAYFSGMYTEAYSPESFFHMQLYRVYKYNETTVDKSTPYDNFIKHEILLNDKTLLLRDSSTRNNVGYIDRLNSEKEYVCERLRGFLLNPENIYELVCVNKKTGVTKTMNTRVKTTS